MASDSVERRWADKGPAWGDRGIGYRRCSCGRQHWADQRCPHETPEVWRCEVWTTEDSVVGPDGGWHEMYAGRELGAETTAQMMASHWSAVRVVGPDGVEVVADERG